MSKKSQSKAGSRARGLRDFGRVQRQLRSEWRRNHEPDLRSNTAEKTAKPPKKPNHYQRAHAFLNMLIGEPATASLTTTAAHTYIDKRQDMTAEKAEELGASTLSEAARRLVVQELVDLTNRENTFPAVMNGVLLGRTALKETTHAALSANPTTSALIV